VNLPAERATGDFIRRAIADEIISAVHDIADGGLLVAAAEMALAGKIGLSIDPAFLQQGPTGALFGEDQGRYLVTVTDPDAFRSAAGAAGVTVTLVGTTGGEAIAGEGREEGASFSVELDILRAAHEAFFPELMGGEPTVA
jgi:phosphoribosylformylglycinamidine synthase